jgi:hypothetical protein
MNITVTYLILLTFYKMHFARGALRESAAA